MKVLIADDHGIVRQGLASLIDKQLNIEVVGEAKDGREALNLARELSPDIIIMDVSMPNLNGADATRLILSENPDIRVIALSMHTEKRIVRDIIQAGAIAYVLKSYMFDELTKALEAAAAGEFYLSPRITGVVLEDYLSQGQREKKSGLVELTVRERQVLQLTAEGKTVKQIARQLHVSPKTADAARRKLMNKLDISSIAELTKYAIREGITSADF
ncbi:MAG: response regulator transcription factor [Sedimentisphaerales bacterium]|nr:response regulator transcription factor [Sedimentisphaerales bacterium]